MSELKDNEFEVWLAAVGNAFHGAGILPLLRITNFRSDVEAPQDLRQTVQAYPEWLTGLAWSAITKTIEGGMLYNALAAVF